MNRLGCALLIASACLVIFLLDLGARALVEGVTSDQAIELVAAGHTCPGGTVLEKGIVEGVTLPERLYWLHLQHDDRTQCLAFWPEAGWQAATLGSRSIR